MGKQGGEEKQSGTDAMSGSESAVQHLVSKFGVRIYRRDGTSFLSVWPDGTYRQKRFTDKAEAEIHAAKSRIAFPGQTVLVEPIC